MFCFFNIKLLSDKLKIEESEYQNIVERVDVMLKNVFEKYDINYQIQEANSVLKSEYDEIDGMLYINKIN